MFHSMFMSKPASSYVPKDEWAETNEALANFKEFVDSLKPLRILREVT
jgi:hypothetical protein